MDLDNFATFFEVDQRLGQHAYEHTTDTDPAFERFNFKSLCRRIIGVSNEVKTAIARHRYPSEERSAYTDGLTAIQNDLWALLGFLLQMKSSVLDFILGTENGHSSFEHFKTTLWASNWTLKATKKLSDARSTRDAALEVVQQLYDKLLIDTETFEKFLYIPASLLVSVFEQKPYFIAYSDNLLFTPETQIELNGIVGLGQKLAFVELGRQWVKKSVGPKMPSVSTLQSVQVELLEKISYFMGNRSIKAQASLDDVRDRVSKEVRRAKSRRFSVAFCGMVKSGKSLFVNALSGQHLLPSDELPATAWPCRLRHVPGSSRPHLRVNTECFKKQLDELRKQQIGRTMDMYRSPKDFLSALADGDPREPQDEPTWRLESMHRVWKDLHESTKRNLLDLEDRNYRIPDSAAGDLDIMNLLGKVNDLVRLCRIFGIELPEAHPDTWPVLSVKFEALKNLDIEDELEFIDLPGIGEANSDFHRFEDLVRIAAREADSVVPIISLNEVARGDWRTQLTSIVRTGLGRAPDYVLCTHLDKHPVSRVQKDFVPTVGKEFWPTLAKFDDRVLYCSPRLGIGAQALLDLSKQEKPLFNLIWEDYPIRYDCAKSVLGTEGAEDWYSELTRDEWVDELNEQLSNSNLPCAVSRLVTGIITSAQGTVLRVEGEKLRLIIKRLATEQRRRILEISRSEEDFQLARKTFLQTREKLKGLQNVCTEEAGTLQNSSAMTLSLAYTVLEADGVKAATGAVESAAKRVNHTIPTLKSGATTSNEIVFDSKFEVEKFYYMAQDEMAAELNNNANRKFVAFVRELAEHSRQQLLGLLVSKLESAIKEDDATPRELVGDILEKLSYETRGVDVLFSSRLRSKVVRTDIERHNAATAYTAIKDVVSKPFLRSGNTAHHLGNKDELGFMLRAPIAVLATIPLVLGSPVWSFMVHKRTFVVDKDTLAKHFHEQTQRPFFASLKKEAETTLDVVLRRSLQQAQNIVDGALRDETARFVREASLKQLSFQDTIILAVEAVSLLWNFSTTESSLLELQNLLDNILSVY